MSPPFERTFELRRLQSGGGGTSGDTAPVAPSDALQRLDSLIQRYLQNEVGGRSVLIGGIRGSGKTTLIEYVLRRPRHPSREALLVPLYGPALFRGQQDAFFQELTRALRNAVLQRITLAFSRLSNKDAAELAEQLRMDANQNVLSLARMRRYWEVAGALPKGVLGRNQGFKEITTLWELTQAYMLVTGVITRRNIQNEKQTAQSSYVQDLGASADNLLKPTLALITAGILGIGLYDTSPVLAAIASAAGAWTIRASLGWRSEQTTDQELDRMVEFQEDTSAAALARWLPGVLQQLRGIGLYPVFMVDEMYHEKEALSKVNELLLPMKSLINEGAVFCFLADLNDYLLSSQSEGNTFSDLIYVGYHPHELVRYVGELPVETTSAAHQAIWKKWAPVVVLRSQGSVRGLWEQVALAQQAIAQGKGVEVVESEVFRTESLIQQRIGEVYQTCLLDGPVRSPVEQHVSLLAMYRLIQAWRQGSTGFQADLEDTLVWAGGTLASQEPAALERMREVLVALGVSLKQSQILVESDAGLVWRARYQKKSVSA